MKKVFWLILFITLCMISCNVVEERPTLVKFMDRLGMTDYPDARTIDRPKKYDYTKVFNVKNERNVNSGINLGSSVQIPYGVDQRRQIEEHDFDAIRDAGFYYVRIPVHFMPNLLVASDTQQEDQNQFDYLDWVINNILERDMIAILCYFSLISDEQFSFDSKEERIKNEENFLTFWKIISERYKEYPAELYFELANEPHDPITVDIWNDYISKVISLIRNSGGNNKTRMIVVPVPIRIKKNIHIGFISHSWNHINGIKELELPSVEEDPYIMVTFHYYEPGAFTFQGESYTEDLARFARKRLGNMWDNTDRQKKLVRKDFDIISQWAQENKRKIILGEFGVTIYADIDSQVNWTTFIREEAESRGMIWIFWGFYDFGSFGALYNQSNRYWNENILNALIPLKKSTVEKRDQVSVQALIASLKDSEWEIRKNAAIALMSRGPEAEPAIPALIEALRDEEWQARKLAAQALTNIGEASYPAIPALIKALRDEEWQVRKPAAQALAAIGPASYPAIPALIKALRDEEWQVCSSAVSALAAIGPASRPALPILLNLLNHEEWVLRKEVVRALAVIAPEDPAVLAALQKSMDDPEAQVSNAAIIALNIINNTK